MDENRDSRDQEDLALLLQDTLEELRRSRQDNLALKELLENAVAANSSAASTSGRRSTVRATASVDVTLETRVRIVKHIPSYSYTVTVQLFI